MQRRARLTGSEIVAFVHSHRTGVELSEADWDSFRSGSLPWIVVCSRDGRLDERGYASPIR